MKAIDPETARKLPVRAAFTLVELLVVVAIITLLISLLLPSLGRAKDQAKTVACASNMRQIGIMAFTYRQEYDGYLPPALGGSGSTPYNDSIFNQGVSYDLQAYSQGLWPTAAITPTNPAPPGLNGLPDNFKMKVFVCPADADNSHTVANNDERKVGYQPSLYAYNSAATTHTNSQTTPPWAIKPENLKMKLPVDLGGVIFMAESNSATGSGINPLTLADKDFATAVANNDIYSTPYGTYLNMNLMFRHNNNHGMNLLYFDGHAGFSANYVTNYSDLSSMGWGYFNYP